MVNVYEYKIPCTVYGNGLTWRVVRVASRGTPELHKFIRGLQDEAQTDIIQRGKFCNIHESMLDVLTYIGKKEWQELHRNGSINVLTTHGMQPMTHSLITRKRFT